MPTTVAVSVNLDRPNGVGAGGWIEFTLARPLIDSAGNLIATASPVLLALDVNGTGTINLYPTNDPATSPNGNYYTVRYYRPGSVPVLDRNFIRRVTVPNGAGSMDFADLPIVAGS